MVRHPSTALTVQPCPFCGGPPTAERLPKSHANGRTTVVMGCAKSRDCNATILVRGSSFGNAVLAWNTRLVSVTVTYVLQPPVVGEPTIGTILDPRVTR